MSDHPLSDDRTLDADPAELERLQRLAQQALDGSASLLPPPEPLAEHTVEADEATFARLRALALGDVPTDASTPEAPAIREATRPPRDLSQLELPDLTDLSRPRPAPSAESVEPWRPPSRSVLPASRQEPAATSAHPMWRWATIALACALLVVVAWIVFGDDEAGNDAPTGPVVTGPELGVITTGVAGQGGSGG